MSRLFFFGENMGKKRKVQKKKVNTLDKYIVFCLSFITIFTIAHTVIFYLTGKEAKTLIIVVIGSLFSELLFCFLIKRLKLHKEAKIVFGKKTDTESLIEDGTDDIEGG